MTYTGLGLLMDNLKQLIYGNHHNPLINNPSVLSKRPQFRLLYHELASIIQTLSIHDPKITDLKKRFKDAAEEAQDIIDLFLSGVDFRNRGLSPVFRTSLNLDSVMRTIESIKVELMAINLNNMKMDDGLKTQSSAARIPLGMKNPMEEIVVGLHDDAEIIRDKLDEDSNQLGIVSIVGMGGLGKTTLATKIYNDSFIVYHFRVRGWATISQTYIKREFLFQILASIGVQLDLEKASDFQLHERLHKHLTGKRYLIVIDDIWSTEAWDDMKRFFPRENTGSRILLTSRLNEVALQVKPHGFVHSLPYLTGEQSWELLREKVFHDDECPEWLIKSGIQIAKKCQGLPLSVVVMAGVLAKEAMSKDLWEKIASSVSSYIVSDQKGNLETLALSYHHLPPHLKYCFLYLGGFPEDFKIEVKRLMWLWGAEGFIEEAGNRSLEDTAESYLMDLVGRNLLIVAERKFDGGVKSCKLHDLVRELCLEKAKEERFFLKIDGPSSSQLPEIIKQRRMFTHRDFKMVNFSYPLAPSIRSLLSFHKRSCFIEGIAEDVCSFALLRVLDLQRCELGDFPSEMASLLHLRYLAIWYQDFPLSICNLWSLQTLVLKTTNMPMDLPSNISDLVNLRHLWSNQELYLPCIEKPMNLQSISEVVLGDGADDIGKWFPSIRNLEYSVCSAEGSHFELLPYLETLRLRVWGRPDVWSPGDEPHNHIRFPATLRKLTLLSCYLPWGDMSIIESIPNLEVLKLKHDAFVGIQWNASEQHFRQLKFLTLVNLNIKHWEAYSTSFPSLQRLAVWDCNNLEETPLEIGDIATLKLIETDGWNESVVESVERIQKEQHDEGNNELKIIVDGMELAIYLTEHEDSESE